MTYKEKMQEYSRCSCDRCGNENAEFIDRGTGIYYCDICFEDMFWNGEAIVIDGDEVDEESCRIDWKKEWDKWGVVGV